MGQHGKFIFSNLYECTYQIVFHFTSSNDLSCQIGSVLYEFTIDKDVLLYVSEYVIAVGNVRYSVDLVLIDRCVRWPPSHSVDYYTVATWIWTETCWSV